MRVKILLLLVGILVLSSCTYLEEEKSDYAGPKIFVVDGEGNGIKKTKVFTIGHDDVANPKAFLEETRQRRFELNKNRSLREIEDENEIFELESKFRNVRMSVDGKTIFGFDEDLDDPDLKEVEE